MAVTETEKTLSEAARTQEQVKLWYPDAETTVTTGQRIQVGVYEDLLKSIKEEVTKDPHSVNAHLKLYLNGVAMDGIEGKVTQPHAMDAKKGQPPEYVVEFSLDRDSSKEKNRKAWDVLLPQLAFGLNDIQLGISLNDAPPHLSAEKGLRFMVASIPLIRGVIIGGLIVFGLLMWWAICTNMLRESGGESVYSLGRTQMAFWGLLVALSFFGVFIISGKMESISEKVLILLGISGATGLSSILIGNSKQSSAAQSIDALEKARNGIQTEKTQMSVEREKLINRRDAAQEFTKEKQDRLVQIEAMSPAEIAALPDDAARTTLKEELIKLQGLRTAGSAFTPAMQAALEEADAKLKALDDKLKAATAAVDVAKKASKPNTDHSTWFTDIISDDQGVSFARFQVVLWTIILGFVFVRTVCTTFSMPEFENTLLALMGISNGTYLGFKIPEKPSGPTVNEAKKDQSDTH